MPLAIRGRPDLTSLMIPWMLCSLHSLCSLLHPFVYRLLMILFEQDAGNGAAP